MSETVLLGRRHQVVPFPRQEWEHELAQVPEHQHARLRFMSPDHHRVRYHVVEQLPISGTPLAPEAIAENLALPVARVRDILEELERQLLFLVRNEQGNVAWAFPVTVDKTPHRLTFSSGEQCYAA